MAHALVTGPPLRFFRKGRVLDGRVAHPFALFMKAGECGRE